MKRKVDAEIIMTQGG